MAGIAARLPVEYSGTGVAPRIIVTYEPILDYNPEVIKIRVYPWNPDELVASGGRIAIAGNAVQRIEAEVVAFSGGDTAQAALPITGGFSWRSLDTIFDSAGHRIYPEFSADADSGLVRCDAEVLGAIEIDYDAGYTKATYTPGARFKTLALEAVWIAAIKNGGIGRLPIESASFGTYLDYVELYSVISDVIIDAAGRWEKPNDWPDDPNYNPLNVAPPDPDESAMEQRTHDRGVIDNKGRVQFDRPWLRYEQPYIGNPNYKPAWRYVQGTPPAGYETSFQDFDFGKLKADLAARYPGLEGA